MIQEVKELLEYLTKEELEQVQDKIIVMLARIEQRDKLRKKLSNT